jgi:hypothetical protein
MTSFSLASTSENWRAAREQERVAYLELVDQIMAGERAGIGEAEMVRVTGLARMTVRKYRRRALEPPTGVFPPDGGS